MTVALVAATLLARSCSAVLAVLLDAWLGEPRRAHPLVGFGRVASAIEARCYRARRSAGVLAWGLAVLPLVALGWLLEHLAQMASSWLVMLVGAGVLYLAIGHRSLFEHAAPVAAALQAGDLTTARAGVAHMVSRDTAALGAPEIAAATAESVLENGCDAVFGALFWFMLLGVPGALLYRLANTLDAMWGYRTPRYRNFGWAAARIDDLLNYVPARLTAASYTLCGGDRLRAWRAWQRQGPQWKSPNAGPVMAAGAAAIGVQLGGAATYHGQLQPRPLLGEGRAADAAAITAALALVRRSLVLWLLVLLMAASVVSATTLYSVTTGSGHA